MPVAHLSDRGIVAVTGADAGALLQGLVTCDVERLNAGEAAAGALLSPQGKILFDFITVRAPDAMGGGFLLDAPAASTADLAKRLNFYKLRAKVTVSDRSAELAITAHWGDDGGGFPQTDHPDLVYADPRLAALGQRAIVPADALPLNGDVGADVYRAHRIALAVPEGGADYAFGEVFPHEAGLDQLGAVAFQKGCYVGQEVVSRMQHRGTARSRMVAADIAADAAAGAGDPVMAGDRRIGDVRARVGQNAIVLVRIDKVADAAADGVALTVNGAPVTLSRPGWANFDMAGEPASSGD